MSFNLLAFDPEIILRDRADFMVWYRSLIRWEKRETTTLQRE